MYILAAKVAIKNETEVIKVVNYLVVSENSITFAPEFKIHLLSA